MKVAFRKCCVEGLDEWPVILEDKGTMIADGAPRIDHVLGLSRSMRSALGNCQSDRHNQPHQRVARNVSTSRHTARPLPTPVTGAVSLATLRHARAVPGLAVNVPATHACAVGLRPSWR